MCRGVVAREENAHVHEAQPRMGGREEERMDANMRKQDVLPKTCTVLHEARYADSYVGAKGADKFLSNAAL